MTCPCHAAPRPPGLHEILTWWTFDPIVILALGLAALLYLRGVRRLWRAAGPGRGVRRREAAAYGAGLATLVLALLSPLDRLSDLLFSAHMSQHELLMLVAPPLLVLGRPVVPLLFALPAPLRARALRLGRRPGVLAAWRALTAPPVALLAHGAALWLWHLPALFQAALGSEAIHAAQHLGFFWTAALFYFGLLQGRYGRAGYGAAVLYVFATALHSGLLGALLSVAGRPWYPAYGPRAARLGVDALADQQLAGLIMWIPAGVVLMVLGLALLSAWVGESERRAARARWLQGALALLLVLAAGCRGRAAARVYVSNEDDGTISVIDAAAGRVVATLAVGKRPRGLRLSADGRTLYVALSGSPKGGPGERRPAPPPDRGADGIAVVDLAAGRVLRTLPSGPDPETFDLTPDGAALYVANEDSGEASAVDLRTGRRRGAVPVGGEPEGVAVRPDGQVVYVTSEAEGHVAVLAIGAGGDRLLTRIQTPPRPRAVAFTPDGARAFVTAELGAAVCLIDARRHEVLAVVPIPREGQGPAGPRPMGVAVSPDGQEAYVTTGRGGAVVALDAATGRLLRTSPGVGARPWGVAVAGDGRIYTANGPSNDVSVLDARTGAVLRRIAAGASPWGVAASR